MTDAGDAGSPVGPEQVLAGRYRLVRLLAEGGMAAVWEGRDEVLARPVAVKVPHARLAADPTFRERFRREAVAAARLAHPGIVATYDTGADGPTDFIVMELVPGRTVGDLVAGGRVPAEVAVPVAAQVAEALDVAHRAGLIHRDVKPANLLLVDDGPSPRVKVADFGVARALPPGGHGADDGEVTREGLVVGTARYLAPEQVAARPVDARADVYALGCVLHEMLAGQPPFVRETDLATAIAHLTEPAPSLASRGVVVDPVLERLVLACLAKDPAARPASALLLARQLRALTAPPAGPPTAAVPMVDLVAGPAESAVARSAGPVGPPERRADAVPAAIGAAGVHGFRPPAPGPGPERPPGAGPAGPERPPGAGPAGPERPPGAGPAGPAGPARPARAGSVVDTAPHVLPAPTPAPRLVAAVPAGRSAAPSGAAPGRHATHTVRRPTRSRIPLVVVGSLVLAALATALLVVALPPDSPTTPVPGATTSALANRAVVAGVPRSFDPEADGRENDSQLPRLVDGNPATTWSSEDYNPRPVFGNLKTGVGVVVALDRPARLERLRVRSPSSGWAAQVYVAGGPAATLAGWGQPVAGASAVQGDLDLDLDGTTGRAVLVWFTHPGRTGQVVVGELELGTP